MNELRRLAMRVISDPHQTASAAALAAAVTDQVSAPANCTGQPCPHCGEPLPRLSMSREGNDVWFVHVSDRIVGAKALKALGRLIAGWAA